LSLALCCLAVSAKSAEAPASPGNNSPAPAPPEKTSPVIKATVSMAGVSADDFTEAVQGIFIGTIAAKMDVDDESVTILNFYNSEESRREASLIVEFEIEVESISDASAGASVLTEFLSSETGFQATLSENIQEAELTFPVTGVVAKVELDLPDSAFDCAKACEQGADIKTCAKLDAAFEKGGCAVTCDTEMKTPVAMELELDCSTSGIVPAPAPSTSEYACAEACKEGADIKTCAQLDVEFESGGCAEKCKKSLRDVFASDLDLDCSSPAPTTTSGVSTVQACSLTAAVVMVAALMQ